MEQPQYNFLFSFIWNIANDVAMKGFMLIFCSLLIAFGATAQSKLGSQTPKKSIFITSILLVLMTLVSCSVGYKNDGKEVTWHT